MEIGHGLWQRHRHDSTIIPQHADSKSSQIWRHWIPGMHLSQHIGNWGVIVTHAWFAQICEQSLRTMCACDKWPALLGMLLLHQTSCHWCQQLHMIPDNQVLIMFQAWPCGCCVGDWWMPSQLLCTSLQGSAWFLPAAKPCTATKHTGQHKPLCVQRQNPTSVQKLSAVACSSMLLQIQLQPQTSICMSSFLLSYLNQHCPRCWCDHNSEYWPAFVAERSTDTFWSMLSRMLMGPQTSICHTDICCHMFADGATSCHRSQDSQLLPICYCHSNAYVGCRSSAWQHHQGREAHWWALTLLWYKTACHQLMPLG